MKIRMVNMTKTEIASQAAAPEFVMVKLSGPFDPQNPKLRRARSLLQKRGSKESVESFDAAIKSGVLIARHK